MFRLVRCWLLLGALASGVMAAPAELRVHVCPCDSPEETLVLKGSHARQQLLVTGLMGDGKEEDFTRKAKFSALPEGVLRIDGGRITPLKNGETLVQAEAEGISAKLKVLVQDFEVNRPINFGNQIVPIFTKTGCNAGGCHGKSGGQNGFKLSLLGFEPGEDYEFLTKEGKSRRVFPAAPERSLLLLKGTAMLPHGGGKKLDAESDDYKLLVRWIGQGMPYGKKEDPVVEKIEVYPAARTLRLGAEQQLVVMARYSDGTKEDVTRSALYEPNDKSMAVVSEEGLVKLFEQPGDVGVMVRYAGKVAVFRATLPLGAPVAELPAPANRVDELVFKKLRELGLPPSDRADDATFLRRSTIDIAGRLPSAEEAKAFLTKSDPEKRIEWVNGLLDSPGYAEYFANKWSALLRNKRNDVIHARGTAGFYNWMRDSFRENKPYDRFVRELLTATGDMEENPPVAWYRQVNNPTMQLEDAAQLFLGQRLQCAQCHHHPFEKWSQEDYYGMAAVFTKVSRKPSRPGEDSLTPVRGMAQATNKKTQKPVSPAALGQKLSTLTAEDDPRAALADWMCDPGNPYFARSVVNRYWKHFFGRGLVDPEDDLRETNPPGNPELLDGLAAEFVKNGFDLKWLVRTICTSQTYQRSANPNEHNQIDKQNYSRFYPRRLTAEVLFDAVHQAVGQQPKFEGMPLGVRAVALPDNSYNASSYFLTVFGRPDSTSACECERSQDASLAQSLHLLNSKDLHDKLASDQGRAAKLALDEKRSDQEKLDELYLATLARGIKPDELALAQKHMQKKLEGAAADKVAGLKRQAYEDIVWALINTREFLFNH